MSRQERVCNLRVRQHRNDKEKEIGFLEWSPKFIDGEAKRNQRCPGRLHAVLVSGIASSHSECHNVLPAQGSLSRRCESIQIFYLITHALPMLLPQLLILQRCSKCSGKIARSCTEGVRRGILSLFVGSPRRLRPKRVLLNHLTDRHRRQRPDIFSAMAGSCPTSDGTKLPLPSQDN